MSKEQNKPLDYKYIEQLMKESGALLEGHFLLSSGLHSPYYLQCALFLRFPKNAEIAGKLLAEKIVKLGKPDFVVSPALGGLIIGHEVARALDVPFLFCEREGGIMKMRRFTPPSGGKYVVVEDVITTGKSTLETIEAVNAKTSADLLGVACIVDRSSGKLQSLPSPISLWQVDFPVYSPEDCPLCKDSSLPLVKPGSRS
ncbi:orotate phosphoribosyltransferase [Thermovirga lienii DSM 17291]|jgi:orotate phosphoribosyltransferase|uniref:Orotate phosphoribosyltransferase n=1 Tax=Thermovirga lienii (strain ATCC BAA-1197 / DSM 17291 / Cas60314) TaxID=580340 RepID=G7VAC4_THELD|nr:orotate phosphoribosyltransferase [Thermovirga lienii]MDN5318157.1 orotate phosphoribosyltransferase [Thermovirga sp.]AER66824.1 orotate phosphoribosyltransferase [Thermovirga lienii DSM 17291]KUK43121.1 MAG: Orotate phosphoribosyltransferase [Thermovirga lienii]MDN5367368.1 orotate phosphoribosyltransferase [Thermovirga sp.]HCD71897.1 orotate phosphoribosyltransferase [Thermovirga lienii]